MCHGATGTVDPCYDGAAMSDLPEIFVSRPLPFDAASHVGERASLRGPTRCAPIAREALLEGVRTASGLVAMLSDRIDAELLDAAPNLRVVANYAVGFDNIDVAAAKARGVVVTNTPDVLTEASADVAFTLLLGVARRAREGHRMVVEGRFDGWGPSVLLGRELHGATLGIIGFGRIGRAMARRGRGFGMHVLVADRPSLTDEALAAVQGERASTPDVIARADFLSLHCPLSEETHHLLDAAALATMKPTAILINTARGPVVDEGALVAALEAGKLLGAGLDVYEKEPVVHSGLIERDDVLLLPHVGSGTTETRAKMAALALDNVLAVLAGEAPKTPVPGSA